MNPCPHREELELLIAESLDNQVEQEVEAHVETCSDCQETLAGLVSAELPSDSDSGPAPPFLNRLLELNPASELDYDWQSLLDECDDAGALGAIGDYIVYEEVGAGAMGVVLKAKDPQLDRMVAIKIIRPELTRHSQYQERFVREAQSMAAIDDPHVVPVYQVSWHNDVPYIVMKYLEGETLADHLKREGTLRNDALRKLGVQIASGLSAVHARGTIHRDLKPSNIWMEAQNSHVRVMDFGLARPEQGPRTTNYDGIIGTPAYMAPEQAQGGAADSRSDLFSLGSVLYEAASGKLPFPGENPLAILSRMATESAAPIRSAVPEIEPAIGNLIDDLVERGAEERPASAGEVISRLTDQAVDASNSKFLGFKLTGILLFGFVMLCGIIFTLKTPTGEIIVELAEGVDPDSVQIQVEGNDLVKVLSEGNWTLDIREGKYNLEMQQGDDRFQLDAKSIVVRRDEQAFLKVQIKSRETTTPMETRSIAEWILSVGGTVSVQPDMSKSISDKEALPTVMNRLHTIDLRDADIVDEDIKKLAGLKSVYRLMIGNESSNGGLTTNVIKCLADLKIPALRELGLYGDVVTTEGLKQISRIPSLAQISLVGGSLGDEDLLHIASLSQLKRVILNETGVSGVGLRHLQHLEIEFLSLAGREITDEALVSLPQWNALHTLRLNPMNSKVIGDAAVHSLKRFSKLKELKLIQFRNLSPSSLQVVQNLRDLERLSLINISAVNDKSIKPIVQDLPILESLTLWFTKITDQGLPSFHTAKQIRNLDLSFNRTISPAAINALKEARPDCKISFTPPQPLSGAATEPDSRSHEAKIANWVASIGGSVSFYRGGHLRTAPKPKPLPTGAFTLVAIDLRDTKATDEDLRRIDNLPDLEHIKLRPTEIMGFTEEGFKILAEANLPKLSKLWVRDCTTRKAALEQIARLDLSELSLHNTQTTDEDLEGLSPLDDLTYLRLAVLPINGNGLQHLTNSSLQTLELFNINCDDDTFSKTPQWPQLRHFKIAYGTFTNRGLADLSQRYQQLESVAIKGTMQGTKIDHRGLEELARLPNLKSLAITDRQQTGFLKQDEIIEAIADLKQLRTLELEDSGFTDKDLQSKGFRQLKNLSTLTFSGKSNLTKDAIESLKAVLPNCVIWTSNAPWKD